MFTQILKLVSSGVGVGGGEGEGGELGAGITDGIAILCLAFEYPC